MAGRPEEMTAGAAEMTRDEAVTRPRAVARARAVMRPEAETRPRTVTRRQSGDTSRGCGTCRITGARPPPRADATGRGQSLAGGGSHGRRAHGGTRLGAASFAVGGRAPRGGPGRARRRGGAGGGAWPGCLRRDRRGPWRPDDRGVPLGPSALTHHLRTRTPHGPEGPARHGRPTGRRSATRPVPLPGAMPPLGPAPRQELPGPAVAAAPQHAPRRPVTTAAGVRGSRTGGRPHGGPVASGTSRTTGLSRTDRTSSSGAKDNADRSCPHSSSRTRGRGGLGTRPAPSGSCDGERGGHHKAEGCEVGWKVARPQTGGG